VEIVLRLPLRPTQNARTGFALTLQDAGGAVLESWASLEAFTEVEEGQVYLHDFATQGALPRAYRLTLRETWDAEAADLSPGGCETVSVRDFVAGGALPRGPAPALGAVAFFGPPAGPPTRRRLQAQVFSDLGIRSRFNVRVRVRCPVIDDGLGHPVRKAVTMRVRLPVPGASSRRWTACAGGPSPLPAGATETAERTFSAPFRVRSAPNGRSVRRWRVQLDQWPIGRSGRLELRRTRYRPSFSRRVYDSDFDRYVAVCINGGRRLRAYRRRHYCTIQEEEESSVATLRIRR
jgi:hypothetical protein